MEGLHHTASGESWLRPIALPSANQSEETQLWLIPLGRPEPHVEELRSCLAPDEVERASRFATPSLQRNYIVGRGAVRVLLGHVLGLHPRELRFTYSPKGKPDLASDFTSRPIWFNLAHSGEHALVGISDQGPIGVDLEWVRPRPDLLEIAARFFAPAEHASLAACSGAEQLARFYRIWTRKEALLKALGHGIAGGLREPDLSERLESSPTLIRVVTGNTEWAIHELTPAPGYQAAVALPSNS